MRFLAIIPARYASTRFPGKPLADIGGKTMIRRVYERTAQAFDYVYVATDNQEIYNEVVKYGGKALMTSSHHINGTSRVLEAMYKAEEECGAECEFVINVQGDEPFIEPEQLLELSRCFDDIENEQPQIATLVKLIEDREEIFNPNSPKVVFDSRMNALYFSRSPIPYIRDSAKESWPGNFKFYKHIGLYGYRRDILIKVCSMAPGRLESAENLEQLRWLENCIRIRVAETKFKSYSVDTPQDLEQLRISGVLI